jgi:hypothetical protein
MVIQEVPSKPPVTHVLSSRRYLQSHRWLTYGHSEDTFRATAGSHMVIQKVPPEPPVAHIVIREVPPEPPVAHIW